MITRVLERLGVFMGLHQERNREARFFLELNEWLLALAGARWDSPEAFDALLAADDVRADAVAHLRYAMGSWRSAMFLGWRRFAFGRRLLAGGTEAWGWKDPRTTLTLPLWLEVFPDALVVLVTRPQDDVVASLLARHETARREARALYARARWKSGIVGRPVTLTDTVRAATREGAEAIAAWYVRRGREQVEQLGSAAIEISYEECQTDAAAAVERLASFVLPARPSPETIRAAASIVEPARTGRREAERAPAPTP